MAFQAGAIVSKLTLDRSKFSASIKTVQKQTRSLGGWVKKNSKQFRGMGLAITAMGAAALVVFKKMVKQYVEVGDMIHKMALRTGFAAETLSELAYAADISGADITMLEKGVKKMSKTIVDASYGLETYLRVFRSLGLEVDDLLKMKPEEQFFKIGAAIAEMENDTLRTAAAVDVFGRSGTMLLPFFKEGAEGIAKLREEAHTLGIIFDEEAATKAAKLKDAQTALTGSVKGLSIAILNDLIPVITVVTKEFTDWFVESRKDADTWATAIISFFEIVAKGAMQLLAGFQILQSGIFEMSALVTQNIREYIEKLIIGFGTLAKLGVPVKGLLKDLVQVWIDLSAVEKGYTDQMNVHINRAADVIVGFQNLFNLLKKVKTGLDNVKDSQEAVTAAQESFAATILEQALPTLESYAFMHNVVGEAAKKRAVEEMSMFEKIGTAATMSLGQSKAGAIAQAIMSTYAGAATTLKMLGMPLAIPFIAMAIISGMKQVAAIMAVSIPSMAEGGIVEHEGPHYLHVGEEVRSARETRGAGPFHTTVYLTIHAKYLDDRTINQAAAKIRYAVNRQGRRG